MRASLWLAFGLLGSVVATGCSHSDADMSSAQQDKIRTALNHHEDPRAHGVTPGSTPAPIHNNAAAQDFLAARKARIDAAKNGHTPSAFGAPPTP